MLGALVADDGTGAELVSLAAGGNRIKVELTHFSTVAIPTSAAELAAQLGQSGFHETALNLLLAATQTDPPDPGLTLALLDHMGLWYDSHIRTLLDTGQSEDFALLAGLRELQQWDERRAALEQLVGDVVLGGAPVRGRLSDRATEGRTLAVTGLAQAFTRATDRCLAGTAITARLADANAAADFTFLAGDYFSSLEDTQGFYPLATPIPSPDLAAHGLDEASVRDSPCVRVVIEDVVVPDLGPGQSGTLTVVAGVSFAGGPTQFTPSVMVRFCPTPGSPGTVPPGCDQPVPFPRTTSTGQVTFPVTATADGTVRYHVCGFIHSEDFRSLFVRTLFTQPCRSSSGGVVVTPSQTTIPPGASRQFTAVVEETDIQDVTWAVQNGAGGTITPTGLFTSNGILGTFFVTATSVANPASVGIAQVTVSDTSPPPPTNDPCPDSCTFSGLHTFRERRTDTGQETSFSSCASGDSGCSGNPVAVTGGSGIPGRNGAISFVCSTGSLVRIDVTLSAGSFTGQVGIVQSCPMPSLDACHRGPQRSGADVHHR
jgi:hypothetical protein